MSSIPRLWCEYQQNASHRIVSGFIFVMIYNINLFPLLDIEVSLWKMNAATQVFFMQC